MDTPPPQPTSPTPKAAPTEPSGGAPGEGTQTDLSQVADAAAQGAAQTAAPEEDETATTADPADPEGEDGEQGQQWPKSAVDRLQRRTRQRDQARQELDKVKAELETLKQQAASPKTEAPQAPSGEYAELGNDPAEIERKFDLAKSNVRVANDLLDDLHDDPDSVAERLQKVGVKLEEFTPQAMRKFLKDVRNAEQQVLDAAPKRIQFLQAEVAGLTRAREVMPELADPNSDRFKAVQEVVRAYPTLRQRPDWAYHAAIYALGYERIQEQAKPAGARPAPAAAERKTPNPPKVPGVGTAQPAKPPSSESRLEALRQKALGPGATREDRNAWTLALLKGA